MSSLTSVGMDLTISQNSTLNSLSLPALRTVGYSFEIIENANLPTAQATTLRNQLVEFTGETSIRDNKP